MIKKILIDAGIFLVVYQLYKKIEQLIYTNSIELTFETDLFFFFILLAIVNNCYQNLQSKSIADPSNTD